MTEAVTNNGSRSIAIFDFDGTLVEGDSLWPFLGYACGWPKVAMSMIKAIGAYGLAKIQKRPASECADPRTFMKTYMMHDLLAGKTMGQLQPAVKHLLKRAKWKADIRQKLQDHQTRGDRIVIASGGLDLYLPALLDGVVHDYALICTEMESFDGMLTGFMPAGNCVRQVKAERVAAYLKANGPFADSWGYGNYPHDVPMLELVNHRILV